jgi:hypothetical protein
MLGDCIRPNTSAFTFSSLQHTADTSDHNISADPLQRRSDIAPSYDPASSTLLSANHYANTSPDYHLEQSYPVTASHEDVALFSQSPAVNGPDDPAYRCTEGNGNAPPYVYASPTIQSGYVFYAPSREDGD